MKRIIRLTESDLIRIVKRTIKEGEEHEEKMKHFVELGYNNLQAFFLTQLDGQTTWDDLFRMYGQSIADSLFNNNPDIFMEFILHSMGTKVPFDKVYEHYPKYQYESYGKLKDMFLNFFNGDINSFDEYLKNNSKYVEHFLYALHNANKRFK